MVVVSPIFKRYLGIFIVLDEFLLWFYTTGMTEVLPEKLNSENKMPRFAFRPAFKFSPPSS